MASTTAPRDNFAFARALFVLLGRPSGALLLMGFLEVTRHSIYLLHVLGVILVVARLLHGLALSYCWQPRFGRVAGAGLTVMVLLIEAVLCLIQGFRGQWMWVQ